MKSICALAIAAGIACRITIAAAETSPAKDVKWTHAEWARPDEPFAVSITMQNGATSQIPALTFRLPDGTEGVVEGRSDPAAKNTAQYAIPNPKSNSGGSLTFGFALKQDGNPIADRTVPYADGEEFYVSGQTGIDLFYPIESWDLLLIFRPCCFIDGGILKAYRLPVIPNPNAPGFPKQTLSSCFSIEPDDLTKATAGLRAEISFDSELAAKAKGTIGLFQWIDSEWKRDPNAVLDRDSGIVRFTCVRGGLFLVGIQP